MPDKNGYPLDSELDKIENWDALNDLIGLLKYIKDLWWTEEWGYKLTGKRVLKLELHTLGWSGNEDIIVALEGNCMFWYMGFEKHIVGGHYYFKFKLPRSKL